MPAKSARFSGSPRPPKRAKPRPKRWSNLLGWLLGGTAVALLLPMGLLYLRGAFREAVVYDLTNVPAVDDSRFPITVMGLADAMPTAGVMTGFWVEADAIYAARNDAIAQAQQSIQYETYYMTPGRRADDFAAALSERSQAGVSVQMLVDAYGTDDMPDDYWQRLRNAGVEVRFFREFDWKAPTDYNSRTHRKLLILDGQQVLLGGAGASDQWDGDSEIDDVAPWLDFEVSYEGAIARLLQGQFWQNWAYEGGSVDVSDVWMPEALEDAEPFADPFLDLSAQSAAEDTNPNAENAAGDTETEAVANPENPEFSDSLDTVNNADADNLANDAVDELDSESVDASDDSPSNSVTPLYVTDNTSALNESTVRLLALTHIAAANERLWLGSPYFVPDASTREALMAARERGVDVRVLTMSEKNDKPLVHYASRVLYGELLAAGVTICEYQPSMMHAKMTLVDDGWVSTGSANFDPRSYFHNDELNVSTAHPQLVASVEQFFADAQEQSNCPSYEEWRERSLWERIQGRFALAFKDLM
ncbi:MAG: cardiolipin synthase B [Kaiparowitsia implicata GSE-PSE-MK54-09C]|jgi:cardiolipin synthase|nr:cardiolipin synthase B [Kaiparowitsia implicata GSE-PSE-MK54-09C]